MSDIETPFDITIDDFLVMRNIFIDKSAIIATQYSAVENAIYVFISGRENPFVIVYEKPENAKVAIAHVLSEISGATIEKCYHEIHLPSELELDTLNEKLSKSDNVVSLVPKK